MKSPVFSTNNPRKFNCKVFGATSKWHGHSGDAEGWWQTQTWGSFPGEESSSNIRQRAETIEKKFYVQEHLIRTNNLRPQVTWNALNCFSRQSIEHHEAQFTPIVSPTRQKVFGSFWQIPALREKKCSQSKLASKQTAKHIAQTVSQF